MARALREGDPCYAASTYALSDALFAQRRAAGGALPPKLYRHLVGRFSLTQEEPAWARLEERDETGFRGLTSSASTIALCDPLCFSEDGFSAKIYSHMGIAYEPQDADVICFVSSPDDECGAHAAVMREPGVATFPPNTRFELQEVVAPGEWEAPNGMRPRQRLLVVSATYRAPRAGGKRGRRL